MPVYTIHIDRDDPEPGSALERMILVPEKFNIWAFLFGPLWLLANRLWLASAAWLVFLGLLVLAGILFGLPAVALTFIHYSIAFLMGLEANNLRRRRLEQRGIVQVDVASGRNTEEAEQRFLTRQDALSRQAVRSAADGSTARFDGYRENAVTTPNRTYPGGEQIGGLFGTGG